MDVSFVIGMIVFAFGLEEIEPNIINRRLAARALAIQNTEPDDVVTVVQWEFAPAFPSADRVVWPYADRYLTSQHVVDEAVPIFREAGVTSVIPVAQPFLHLPGVCQLIKAAGFTVERRPIPKIGFDSGSLQPWTRSRHGLLAYALRSKLLGTTGKFIPTRQSDLLAVQHRSASVHK